MLQQIATARSLLFVPGARPDRFQKAVASVADAIVLDLEDAVAPDDKSSAPNWGSTRVVATRCPFRAR